MRTDLVAGELTLLQSGEYDEHWRLKIANGDGTMVDVSSRLKGGTVHLPNPDAPIGTAEVRLWRDINDDATESLAPLVAASAYNRLDDGVTYAPLISIGRAATLEIAITARLAGRPTDGSTSWHEVLGGFVKQPSLAQYYGDISIELHDRAYKLMRTYVETPQLHVAGTAIEDVVQAVLDNTMGSGAYTLTVDSSGSPSTTTGEVLGKDYKSDIIPVWESVQELVKAIGRVLWYRYDASGAAQLVLTEPRRTKTVVDYTFTTAQINDISSLTIIEENIRNVVVVGYLDSLGAQQEVTAEDATSIAAYGGIRRYVRFAEDMTSPIRSAEAATVFRDAALSDLMDPDADQAIATRGAWWPGEAAVDLYGFSANTYIYDVDQTFAPYGTDITFDVGQMSSATIKARGKPSAGSGTWLARKPGNPGTRAVDVSIYGFQLLYDTPLVDQVTIQWTRGADVFEVWDYVKTLTAPVTEADKPYPLPEDGVPPTDTLSVGTDELVVDVPAAGDITFIQFEARDSDLAPTNVYRFDVHPKAMSTGTDIPAGSILAEALIKAAQTYALDVTWSASSATAGAWSSGTLTFADDTTYSIASGSVSSLTSSPTFVYFDPAVSTTVLQTTTNWGAVVGSATLVAIAWSGTVKANIVPGVGVLGLDGNAIHPLSIQTGNIAANAITAAKISVVSLAAISADLGTVTAGTISTAVLVASESFTCSTATFNGDARFGGDILVGFTGAPAPGTDPANGSYFRDYVKWTETTLSDSYLAGIDILSGGDYGVVQMYSDKGIKFGASADLIAFYDGTPVALQTGVAVTAAGIHAALVALNLITA